MNARKQKPTAFALPNWLALTLALVITLVGGGLYGSFSQRWGPSPDMVGAGARVTQMPTQIGAWQMVEESEMDPSTVRMLECAGYVSRAYVHQASGKSIQMVLLVGPPGPIAVHTPEICFSSRAFDLEGERTAVAIPAPDGETNTFWRVDFTTKTPLADALRVYYAWSTGDTWQASKSPRFEFGGARLLYKIQLAAPIAARLEDDATDPGRDFLEALEQSGWKLLPG